MALPSSWKRATRSLREWASRHKDDTLMGESQCRSVGQAGCRGSVGQTVSKTRAKDFMNSGVVDSVVGPPVKDQNGWDPSGTQGPKSKGNLWTRGREHQKNKSIAEAEHRDLKGQRILGYGIAEKREKSRGSAWPRQRLPISLYFVCLVTMSSQMAFN